MDTSADQPGGVKGELRRCHHCTRVLQDQASEFVTCQICRKGKQYRRPNFNDAEKAAILAAYRSGRGAPARAPWREHVRT